MTNYLRHTSERFHWIELVCLKWNITAYELLLDKGEELLGPNSVPVDSVHSIKISVYCEQYLRDAPVIRNKYERDLWSNLVSNLCYKFKGYSLSNGRCIFIYGKISCSCGMCRSVQSIHAIGCMFSALGVIPQIKRPSPWSARILAWTF